MNLHQMTFGWLPDQMCLVTNSLRLWKEKPLHSPGRACGAAHIPDVKVVWVAIGVTGFFIWFILSAFEKMAYSLFLSPCQSTLVI